MGLTRVTSSCAPQQPVLVHQRQCDKQQPQPAHDIAPVAATRQLQACVPQQCGNVPLACCGGTATRPSEGIMCHTTHCQSAANCSHTPLTCTSQRPQLAWQTQPAWRTQPSTQRLTVQKKTAVPVLWQQQNLLPPTAVRMSPRLQHVLGLLSPSSCPTAGAQPLGRPALPVAAGRQVRTTAQPLQQQHRPVKRDASVHACIQQYKHDSSKSRDKQPTWGKARKEAQLAG